MNIFKAFGFKKVTILGEEFTIKRFSAAERINHMKLISSDDSTFDKILDSQASLIIKGVVKETGEKMFTEKDAEKIKTQVDYKVVEDLAEAIAKYNGLAPESEAEAVKNSETIQTDEES